MSLTITNPKELKGASWFKPLTKIESPWIQGISSVTAEEDMFLDVQSIINSDKSTASAVGSLSRVTATPTVNQTSGKPGSKTSPPKPATGSSQVFLTSSVDPQEIKDLNNEASLFVNQLGFLQDTVVPHHRGLYIIKKPEDRRRTAGIISLYDFQIVSKFSYPLATDELRFVNGLIDAVEKLHQAGVIHNRLLETCAGAIKVRGKTVHKLKHIGLFRDKDDDTHAMVSGLKKAKEGSCRVVKGRPCCEEMANIYDIAGVSLEEMKGFTSWKDWLSSNRKP